MAGGPALRAACRRATRLAPASASLQPGVGGRGVHGGRPKDFHATESRGYSNDYIHAETMYNLTAMTNRKLKFGALVWGGVFAGIFIPLIACSFQQRKAQGGV